MEKNAAAPPIASGLYSTQHDDDCLQDQSQTLTRSGRSDMLSVVAPWLGWIAAIGKLVASIGVIVVAFLPKDFQSTDVEASEKPVLSLYVAFVLLEYFRLIVARYVETGMGSGSTSIFRQKWFLPITCVLCCGGPAVTVAATASTAPLSHHSPRFLAATGALLLLCVAELFVQVWCLIVRRDGTRGFARGALLCVTRYEECCIGHGVRFQFF